MPLTNFEAIIKSSRAVVFAAVRRYCTRVDGFDDIAQEVYLKLFRLWKQGKLQRITALEAYIYTMTKHVCFCLESQEIETVGDDYLETYPGAVSVLNAEEQQELQAAVNTLPEKYRDIIGYLLSGYTQIELAHKLKININTLKSMVKRAKVFLTRERTYL